jgi:hypothetical protein
MIETFDLSKYFDDFKAVDGVTLTVARQPGFAGTERRR